MPDTRAIPLMTLCGGLLVYGHVAQPLFVVPGFLLALGVWIRNLRSWPRGALRRGERRSHAADPRRVPRRAGERECAIVAGTMATSVAVASGALATAAPAFVPLMHVPGLPALIQSAMKARGANRVLLEVEPEHWSDGLTLANALARIHTPFRV